MKQTGFGVFRDFARAAGDTVEGTGKRSSGSMLDPGVRPSPGQRVRIGALFYLNFYHGVLAPGTRDLDRIVAAKPVEDQPPADRGSSAPPGSFRRRRRRGLIAAPGTGFPRHDKEDER